MSQGAGDLVWKKFWAGMGLRGRSLTAKDAKKGREGRQGRAGLWESEELQCTLTALQGSFDCESSSHSRSRFSAQDNI